MLAKKFDQVFPHELMEKPRQNFWPTRYFLRVIFLNPNRVMNRQITKLADKVKSFKSGNAKMDILTDKVLNDRRTPFDRKDKP